MPSNNPRYKETLKPFKKGEDKRRNLRGRPPKLPELDKLLDAVLGEEKNGVTAAQLILKALKEKAAKGDVRAAEVILNRAYGKPKETIEHKGDIVKKQIKLPDGTEIDI